MALTITSTTVPQGADFTTTISGFTPGTMRTLTASGNGLFMLADKDDTSMTLIGLASALGEVIAPRTAIVTVAEKPLGVGTAPTVTSFTMDITAAAAVTPTVVGISPPPAALTPGVALTIAAPTVLGLTAPIKFTLVDSRGGTPRVLPAGLTLNNDGSITGTPTTRLGAYGLVMRAVDVNNKIGFSQPFSIDLFSQTPIAGDGASGGGGTTGPVIVVQGINNLTYADFASALAANSLVQAEDHTFGSSAVANSGPGALAIQSLAALGQYYNPTEGEYSAPYSSGGTRLSGTQLYLLNSNIQNMNAAFDGENHIMDADGLRLQATLRAGTFNTYLRVQNQTTSGIWINKQTNATMTPTPIANIGMTQQQFQTVSIGDICTMPTIGAATVWDLDPSAFTITFVTIASGTSNKFDTGNYQLAFTHMAFCPLDASAAPFTATKTLLLAKPLPSYVGEGWAVRLCYNGGPPSSKDTRVAIAAGGISTDRKTITLTTNLADNNSAQYSGAGNGAAFIPFVSSGAIWDHGNRGPHILGRKCVAYRTEFMMQSEPTWSSSSAGGIFTKAQWDTWYNTYGPGSASNGTLGHWPAWWWYGLFDLNNTGFGSASHPVISDEIDWEGYLHGLNEGSNKMTIALHGGRNTGTITQKVPSSWKGDINYQGVSPWNGWHSYGVVWDNTGITRYVDDVPISFQPWTASANNKWGLQTGWSNQIGTLGGGTIGYLVPALLFPQNNNDATKPFMKIRRFQSWVI